MITFSYWRLLLPLQSQKMYNEFSHSCVHFGLWRNLILWVCKYGFLPFSFTCDFDISFHDNLLSVAARIGDPSVRLLAVALQNEETALVSALAPAPTPSAFITREESIDTSRSRKRTVSDINEESTSSSSEEPLAEGLASVFQDAWQRMCARERLQVTSVHSETALPLTPPYGRVDSKYF